MNVHQNIASTVSRNVSNLKSVATIPNVVQVVETSPWINIGWTYILLLLITALLCGSYLTYHAYATSPWYSDRYYSTESIWSWLPNISTWELPTSHLSVFGALKQESEEKQHFPESASASTTVPEKIQEARKHEAVQQQTKGLENPSLGIQTWCLVGEDLAGRYCVKVPGPSSCTPNRTYSSEDDCRLTPAMHLPAGKMYNEGTRMTPLRDLKIV